MRPTSSPSARLARGGINWVTAFLLLLVVGGGYLAWTWVPVYVIHFEVTQVVRDYMNRAVKDPDDAALVQSMVRRLQLLDKQTVPDESGKLVSVATVQVDPRDVTWVRSNTTPPTLHVEFQYTRTVEFPLLQRWTARTLSIDLDNDLTRPDWGPSR